MPAERGAHQIGVRPGWTSIVPHVADRNAWCSAAPAGSLVRRNGWGPVYWTVCTVAACDPGREFAFTVAGPGGKTVNTWRYQLQPAADGTDVTESFELPGTLLTRLYWMVAGSARSRTNMNGMRVTLEKMKAVVETAGRSR